MILRSILIFIFISISITVYIAIDKSNNYYIYIYNILFAILLILQVKKVYSIDISLIKLNLLSKLLVPCYALVLILHLANPFTTLGYYSLLFNEYIWKYATDMLNIGLERKSMFFSILFNLCIPLIIVAINKSILKYWFKLIRIREVHKGLLYLFVIVLIVISRWLISGNELNITLNNLKLISIFAICEEVWYRGVAFVYLINISKNITLSIIVSAFYFALMHIVGNLGGSINVQLIFRLIDTTILGILLNICFLRFGLAGSTVIHILWNILIMKYLYYF